MTTPADIQALSLMANVDNQEFMLALQRYEVLQASRAFTVSPVEGAQLLNITEELYNRWFNMVAQESAVSAMQGARYQMIAEIIREARKQHALQQANIPVTDATATPTVN